MNIVVLQGVVSRPAEMRELADGTTLAMLEVATETPTGRLVVPVAWSVSGRSVPEEGSDVVVTGQVRRRFFRTGGATQSRTEVVADAVVPVRSRSRARRAVEDALAGVWGGAP
jgi:single-strand DNA-binding protein